MKRKLKNMKGKAGIILLAALTTILATTSILPTAVAEQEFNGDAPDNLEIIDVSMTDYNLRCQAMGGQDVGITATVKNTGGYTITEDFEVEVYIGSGSKVTDEDVTEDLSPGEEFVVDLGEHHIDLGIGDYTMDCYIDMDGSTKEYCEFEVTLFGISS